MARTMTKPWLMHAGNTGINLEELTGWEANEERTFLVLHMKGGQTFSLRNARAEGMLVLLEAASQLHMGDWQRDRRNDHER